MPHCKQREQLYFETKLNNFLIGFFFEFLKGEYILVLVDSTSLKGNNGYINSRCKEKKSLVDCELNIGLQELQVLGVMSH